MISRVNHSRSIVLGDYCRNKPLSSSPDISDKISDLYLIDDILRKLRSDIVGTCTISGKRKRRFKLKKAICLIFNSHLARLPRALSVAQKAIEDQISSMKAAFRKEPITGSQKIEFLEKSSQDQDN